MIVTPVALTVCTFVECSFRSIIHDWEWENHKKLKTLCKGTGYNANDIDEKTTKKSICEGAGYNANDDHLNSPFDLQKSLVSRSGAQTCKW